MRIREWRVGTRDVFVDGKMVAVLVGVGDVVEVWEFDNDRMMTTGKCFGLMTMEEVEFKYGPLEGDDKNNEINHPDGRRKESGAQLTIFEKWCSCGARVDVVQMTIEGEEHYCHACYSEQTEEKGAS